MCTENLVTTNMGDMAKSPFLQFFFLSLSLSFSFFSLNPRISKTVRGTGLKFCITKYGNTLYNRDGRGLCPLCLYIRNSNLHFHFQ